MAEKKTHKAGQILTTPLYDPITGFIFASELFEKDLYRDKMVETRAAPISNAPSVSNRIHANRSNP